MKRLFVFLVLMTLCGPLLIRANQRMAEECLLFSVDSSTYDSSFSVYTGFTEDYNRRKLIVHDFSGQTNYGTYQKTEGRFTGNPEYRYSYNNGTFYGDAAPEPLEMLIPYYLRMTNSMVRFTHPPADPPPTVAFYDNDLQFVIDRWIDYDYTSINNRFHPTFSLVIEDNSVFNVRNKNPRLGWETRTVTFMGYLDSKYAGRDPSVILTSDIYVYSIYNTNATPILVTNQTYGSVSGISPGNMWMKTIPIPPEGRFYTNWKYWIMSDVPQE